MIRTKLTERYGIELPFVSAGMGLPYHLWQQPFQMPASGRMLTAAGAPSKFWYLEKVQNDCDT
jgi:hypothetical protein